MVSKILEDVNDLEKRFLKNELSELQFSIRLRELLFERENKEELLIPKESLFTEKLKKHELTD